MSSFTKPLIVEHLDGKLWKLVEGFNYYLNQNEIVFVPPGFVCDFASIPRLFWTLIGHPTGPYGKAAVIHDYLYRIGAYSRKKSDKIFLGGMEVLKVPRWKRKVMYRFVRTFGCFPWRKYRKKEK